MKKNLKNTAIALVSISISTLFLGCDATGNATSNATGNLAPNATSGNLAPNATSGNLAPNATSGNLAGNTAEDVATAVDYKSVMHLNDTVFGKTSGRTYDMGAMLYADGKKVGFIDIDGIVYESEGSEDVCGGTVRTLCISAQFNDDNTLASDCMLSRANDIVIPGERPPLPGPARSIECGDRIK